MKLAFETVDCDAVTINPYLGKEANKPFLDQSDRGIIVLCRTSNKGAGEFQDRLVIIEPDEIPDIMGTRTKALVTSRHGAATLRLYELVAHQVANHWNEHGNCNVVVGATCPEELAQVRTIVGDMGILIPGLGKQGGDAQKTVQASMLGIEDDERVARGDLRGIIHATDEPDYQDDHGATSLRMTHLFNEELATHRQEVIRQQLTP